MAEPEGPRRFYRRRRRSGSSFWRRTWWRWVERRGSRRARRDGFRARVRQMFSRNREFDLPERVEWAEQGDWNFLRASEQRRREVTREVEAELAKVVSPPIEAALYNLRVLLVATVTFALFALATFALREGFWWLFPLGVALIFSAASVVGVLRVMRLR